MYSASDLRGEVRQIIEARLVDNQFVPQAWIVKAVLDSYPFPPDWEGTAREFAAACCAAWVKHEARKQLREFRAKGDPAEAGAAQQYLPNFPWNVQRAYWIQRNGEPGAVSVTAMTDGELDAKAEEIEAMSRGTARHAAELRRYRAERGNYAAAAE